MPADATIQNALIVIAVAVSVQTVLLLCTVIAMSVAWKRAQVMLNAQLNHFGERLDDMATQTRIAVDASAFEECFDHFPDAFLHFSTDTSFTDENCEAVQFSRVLAT